MSCLRTVVTHNHAQLGLPDKGRAIKEYVVCNLEIRKKHVKRRNFRGDVVQSIRSKRLNEKNQSILTNITV